MNRRRFRPGAGRVGYTSGVVKRALVLGLGLALAGSLVASCAGGSGDVGRPAADRGGSSSDLPPGVRIDRPYEVGTLGLPDVSTEPPSELRFKAPPGGLLVVYFGYTNCPDICPTTLGELGAALDLLTPAERSRVEVAFATGDPERDTPEVMVKYLGHFFDGAHALRTDDPDRMAEVTRAFDVTIEKEAPDARGDYAVGHTSALFAVDPEGRVPVMWPTGMEPEDLARGLRAMLRRAGS